MKKRWVVPLVLLFAALTVLAVLSENAWGRSRIETDICKRFILGMRLLEPERHDNLTIIPVQTSAQNRGISIKTLDEALSDKSLVVKEISQQGSVNSLAVINESKEHVYIMAGEILAGSKQDRILKEDVLIPPLSNKVIVNAYCVEHGRWTYKSDSFYSDKKAANISVRQSARDLNDQSAVWGKVAETNKSVDAAAPTGSLSRSYDSEKVKSDKKLYDNRFHNLPSRYPSATGVIVLINGKVLVADVFSNREIFRRLWPKLLDSYTMEAISGKSREIDSTIESARTFLSYAFNTEVTYRESPGVGKIADLKSDRVVGSSIVYDGPIHMELFPKLQKRTETKPSLQRNYNTDVQYQQNVNRPVDVD